MPFGSEQWMYASGADFTIDQSLRFNDDDSAYLSRTPAGAGNRKTWTFSCWLKRCSEDRLMLAGAYTSGSDTFSIELESSGKIHWYDYNGGYNYHLNTNQLLRDPSAWYHIVFTLDTTQGTEANRAKIYINGTQVTSFSTETYPSLNFDGKWNTSVQHSIGTEGSNVRLEYDGYMAEVHFIDGTALTPSSFGETGDYGEWKPIEVSGLTYGTNGFYLSFAGGGIMSATGGTITTDGDYKVHSFTADGTFTPTSISNGGEVEYLVIAGGGGGGGVSNADSGGGGGGGAGGYRTGYLAVTSQAYSITVGDGGAGGVNGDGSAGSDGEDSVFSTITSDGGGRGAGYATGQADAGDGGSGGGQDGHSSSTPGGSATSGQGYDGGAGSNYAAAGGGGSSAVGVAGASQNGGAGGAGTASSITGSAVTKAGGGGGGAYTGSAGSAGSGGAGAGGAGGVAQHGVAGTANTGSGGGGGGGGGGSATRGNGGAGGSGIVIIRYKFQ